MVQCTVQIPVVPSETEQSPVELAHWKSDDRQVGRHLFPAQTVPAKLSAVQSAVD